MKNIYLLVSKLLLSIGMFSISTLCWANMVVYPMESGLDSNGTAQVRVLSKSNETQYIKIVTKQILRAATSNEYEVLAQPGLQDSLVVTPGKLGLAAGSQRVIRLISLILPEKETVWRVYFEGVNSAENEDSNPNTVGSTVGINLVWGVLVHVPPRIPVIALSLNSATGQVTNNGTQRVVIKQIGFCSAAQQCRWEDHTANIYPEENFYFSVLKLTGNNTEIKIRYVDWIKKKSAEYIIRK
ncbi:fimbrial protein [Yersinia thracica]|uniref:fimbrial protein n=1 Tax=Yersinia thracica TaxID=2890319 RepID=UPI0011A62E52|nr:fimbrial protein [Yersinia thracica]